MRVFVAYFFVFLPVILFCQKKAGFVFDHIDATKGFPAKTVQAIAKDKDGILWMLTDKGLLKYNGVAGKIYPIKKDSSSVLPFPAHRLYIDKEGLIWISYIEVCITSFDPKTEKFTHYYYSENNKKGFPPGAANQMYEDSKGNFWMAVWSGGLTRFDKKTGTFTTYSPDKNNPSAINTNNITGIAEQENGTFLISCWEGGEFGKQAFLQIFDPKIGTFSRFPYEDYTFTSEQEKGAIRYALKIVHFIHLQDKDNIWIGSYIGLIHIDKKNKTIKRHSGVAGRADLKFAFGNYENARSYVVIGSKIWVATEVTGIMIIDVDTKECSYSNFEFSNSSTIRSDNVISMYKGDDNTIWVTTTGGGIDIFTPFMQQFKIIGNANLQAQKANRAQSNTAISDLLLSKNTDNIYISHGNGITILNRKTDSISRILTSDLFSKHIGPTKTKNFGNISSVKKVMEFKNKLLIANGFYAMLYDPASGKAKFVDSKYTYLNITCNDQTNEIYAQAYLNNFEGRIFKIKNNRFIFKINPDNLSVEDTIRLPHWKYSDYWHVEARMMVALDKENWFLDCNKLLFCIYNSKTKTFTEYSGRSKYKNFPDSGLVPLTVDGENNVWLSGDNGFYKFDYRTGIAKNYGEQLGVTNQNIYSVTFDKKGIMWLATRQELIKFNVKTGDIFRYNSKLGLNVGSFSAVISNLNTDDKIYIPTTYGLLNFSPDQLAFDKQKPKLFLSSLIINKDTVSQAVKDSFVTATPKLNYDQNFITLEFGSYQFYTPGPKQFMYRMVGLDSTWYNNESRNYVSYANLSPGSYVFEICCKNVYGIMSHPLKLSFSISPPIWKRWWFIGIEILLALLVLMFYVKYRERALTAQKEKLEAKVSERTKEVVEKAKEIELQNVIIQEKNKALTDSIRYAEKIQQTLLAHKDYMNKYLPEHFVLFKPKDIVSGDFYWAANQDELFYLAICDSTGHGVPGAFMSLLNISFLNEAISDKKIIEPHLILNYVRERLISGLSADGTKDGMDGTLICYNKNKNLITYASANNKPLLIRDGKMQELPADKMPIGQGVKDESFNLYTIELKRADKVYFYSDGYADQFGGPKGKKFKYKQLNELLLSNSSLSSEEQKTILENHFDEWRHNLEQVDDVLLIGILI